VRPAADDLRANLIHQLDPAAPMAEQYRILRANLKFLQAGRALGSILVTSSLPREGKTVTAANLAIAQARAGVPTAIVDADLRRPVLHLLFGLDNRVGLTDLLAGTVPPGDLGMVLRPTEVPNLAVLPSGPEPPSPAELLGLPALPRILAELRAGAYSVLIDSPPVLPVADAVILSALVDGVLLVLRAGATPVQAVQRSRTSLERARARILGVVLNGASPFGPGGRAYRYLYGQAYRPGQARRALTACPAAEPAGEPAAEAAAETAAPGGSPFPAAPSG